MKNDIFKKYDKNILWEKPIEAYGVVIYPVLMKDIFEFYESISTLQINPMELNFGEMTEQMSSLSYLELIIILAMNDSSFKDRMIKILMLAFGVSDSDIKIKKNDAGKFILIIVQNEKEVQISGAKFNKIKDIICYQNSIDILDLLENQRILEANRRVDELNKDDNITIQSQIYSLAAISQVDISTIEKWSISRFKKMIETHDNILNYKIYKSAEMSGFVTFKGGNPFKSWIAKSKDTTKDLKTVDDLAKTFGMKS